ncbi:ABC transporter ATP-binding protein [Metallumcola ferriviriculae]|uniref:ABC transporter ATP-binding protein n=2 Tax=Metallumcola ferriviriculae TaxID=3039180 RepID=A0AAU0UPG8_9FIRM|nr:ABC transporter ATP-binding protein [Desulfitibacteraceae bacterium MK1]
MVEAIIEMQGVSWIRDGIKILKGIEWQVRPGENWAVMGLNGSGKTTLLDIINGYIYPSLGRVTVLGHTFGASDLREMRKSIGLVSSSLQEKLYLNETAAEIILSGCFATIGLYQLPGDKEKHRAEEIMAELECSHFAHRRYKTLSQGERQKVMIGRALASSPDLLILDEPCSGLDLFAREQLLDTVERISRIENPPTLIYVTHHAEEILPAFSHTLLMRRGETFAAGETGAILTGDSLSEFFERPVAVKWRDGRAWIDIDRC